MADQVTRRRFLLQSGISAAAANFMLNLPSLASGAPVLGPASRGWGAAQRKQRLVFVFTPNGVIPKHFWPSDSGRDFVAKRILEPLEPFRQQLMTIKGLCNRIKGDGDGHMRGIGCLLTGIELFPGDIQGGSDTPAGWSMGISIDQFLKNRLQENPATQTRFGSLEFGVMVPQHADTWTRMCYAGPNQPVAPIDNPYQMFDRLYGQAKNRELLASVLDDLTDDFRKIEAQLSQEDRHLLRQHVEIVRQTELDLKREQELQARQGDVGHAVPQLPANIKRQNDNIPTLTKLQMDLMVNSFLGDFTRIASLQITNSVGQPRMTWLGIEEGHHDLSHEPDSNEEAYEKLIRINTWYCEQIAYLAQRLAETPEPGADGSMLDHTTIIWTNELGKGNSHTRDDIPFVLVGGGLGFQMGQSIRLSKTNHNRFLMTIAAAMGHPVESFGNPDYCTEGVLTGLT